MKSFLEEVGEDLVKRLGQDLENSALIFVNKRPLVFIQKFLSEFQSLPSWGPSLFTVQEFLGLSSEYAVGDAYTQFFCLWEAYKEVLNPQEAEALKMDQFYGLGMSLISDFNQLDEEMIPVEIIYKNLRDRAIIDREFGDLNEDQIYFLKTFWNSFSKNQQSQIQERFIGLWERMPLLYLKFHSKLKSAGLTTYGKIYRELAEGSALKPEFIEKFEKGKLVFIGFNALSRSESKLFQRWQKEGKALFYFDVDSYYLDDGFQESGQFLRKNILELKLENALGPAISRIKSSTKKLNLYSVQGATVQAKILPQIMDGYLQQLLDKHNSNKIAIILADESLLIPVLQSIPYFIPGTGEKIPLNITMGYPLKSSPLFSLLNLWILFQQEINIKKRDKISFWDLEAILSHPWMGGDPSSMDAFRTDRFMIGTPEIDLKEILGALPLLEIFLRRHQDGLESLNTLIQILETYASADIPRGNGLDIELLMVCIQEFRILKDSLLDFRERISLPLLISLLKKIMKSISIPLAGEPLQGLQIMGLMETRSLDFETIFILGASDSFLPQSTRRESLIPPSIRKAYGLSVPEDQDALSAYVFYRLLQRSQEVHLLYNSVQNENNSGEPSRFIRQLEFESGILFHKSSYSPLFQSQKSMPIEVKKTGRVAEALKKFYDLNEPFRPHISATQWTTFLQCSLKFYYKVLAGIPEPPSYSEEMEPGEMGSLLHYLMEKIYLKFYEESTLIHSEDLNRLKKDLPSILDLVFVDFLTNKKKISRNLTPRDKIVGAVILKYAERILDQDIHYAPFRILHLENERKFNLDFPIKIDHVNQTLFLYGIIDRIDQKGDIIRIVDYKTGSDKLDYTSLESLFDPNTRKENKALIQTLFYAKLVRENMDFDNPEPHLYLVKDFKKGTQFTKSAAKKGEKKVPLEGDFLKEEMNSFLGFMKTSLETLFDKEIPFTQTRDRKQCEHCPYKIPCGR